jgi:hypothetical protein
MNIKPDAAGDFAAVMATLYIALALERRAIDALEKRLVSTRLAWTLTAGPSLTIGMYLTGPILVFALAMRLAGWTVDGRWGIALFVTNLIAVSAQLITLFAVFISDEPASREK